jgi:hypothetical protein
MIESNLVFIDSEENWAYVIQIMGAGGIECHVFKLADIDEDERL